MIEINDHSNITY